jgi:Leucine-rich repeat (LRR) protein
VDITGSLRHLTELQVLMLQGNQLKHLTDVIHELGRMQRLQVLSKKLDNLLEILS